MRKHILLFLLLIGSIFIQAQDRVRIVSLKPDSALKNIRFSCAGVIDARPNKDDIGHIPLGFSYEVVQLEGDFTEHLKRTIIKLLPFENDKSKLLVIVRDLEVTEKEVSLSEHGFCRVEIEFAKKIDTSLYSLGVFDAHAFDKGASITSGHEKRIIQCLEVCFRKLDETNWESSKGQLIEDINKQYVYDYKKIPPKGAYFSFKQMVRGIPQDSAEVKIKQVNQSKKHPAYNVKVNNKDNPKDVLFVSDGNHIYLRINQFNFVKSQIHGKYIYFQGRLPVSFDDGIGFSFYMATGLLGMTLVSGGGGSSMSGIVLETETGNVKGVTDYYIVNETKLYPEILKEYRASKRNLEAKENVIKRLNAKFD